MSSAGNRAANSSELSLEGYSESMLPEQSSPPQSLRLSVGNLKCRYPHINLIKVCFCYFWFLCFFFFFFFFFSEIDREQMYEHQEGKVEVGELGDWD